MYQYIKHNLKIFLNWLKNYSLYYSTVAAGPKGHRGTCPHLIVHVKKFCGAFGLALSGHDELILLLN